MKHTKGKWYAVEYCGVYKIQDTNDYTGNDLLDEDQVMAKVAKANAKLIIAAPELLKDSNLDKLDHLSDKWWKQAEKCDELRNKAIKKATK